MSASIFSKFYSCRHLLVSLAVFSIIPRCMNIYLFNKCRDYFCEYPFTPVDARIPAVPQPSGHMHSDTFF